MIDLASPGPLYTDVMQAWSGVATTVLTLGALIATGLLLRHQQREARDARADATEERELARTDRELFAAERRDREMLQARRIRPESASVSGQQRENSSLWNATQIAGRVGNDSGDYIDEVHVEAVATGKFAGSVTQLVGPARLTPGKSELYTTRNSITRFSDQQDFEAFKEALQIRVRFTDVAGLRWERTGAAQPVRVFRDEDEARRNQGL